MHYKQKIFYPYGKGVGRPEGSGGRWTLNKETFMKFPLLYPPKEEQDQIVKYLDNKLSKINKFINLKKKQIELLKEQKQAIINHAVTKGLDPNAKMKPSGVEWIGDIPEGWGVVKLKSLGKFINGYAYPSDKFTDSGIRVMKISNIQTMKIDWTDESFIDESYYNKYPNFRVKKGDLVIALTRPIISTGIKAAFVNIDDKILLNQRNSIFRVGKNILLSWLYYVIFNSNFVEAFDLLIDKTGQQPNVSTNDIQNIYVPKPNIEEQKEIVSHIESQTFKIDQTISTITKEINLITEYRTSLISSVVTGKVDVRDIEVEEFEEEIEEIYQTEDLEEYVAEDEVDLEEV